MTILQELQLYFEDAAAHLGQVTGLDPAAARETLASGLPTQLAALGAHAAQPEGRAQLRDAVANLPAFGPVGEVLAEPEGAAHLEQAGALLSAALLGMAAPQGGGAQARLLNMTLPLLLSRLGQQGDVVEMLGEARSVGSSGPAGADGLGAAEPGAVAAAPDAGSGSVLLDKTPTAEVELAGAAGLAGAVAAERLDAGTADLLTFVRAQFAGKAAEQIGRAAGFSAGTSSRAVQGALPVVLNAIINRGKTDAGAAEVLRQGQEFGRLLAADGGLAAASLGDSAELARLEGQGRGLLGGLFGNIEALTGRLGTALGGGGASAGRLLALLSPLVLALLARQAQARSLSAAGLGTELAALGPQLPGLIPSGMGGLTALLGAGSLVSVAPPPKAEVVARAAPVTAPARADTSPTPDPVVPPITPPPAAPTPERHRAFPWWLLPLLLLLLLGGCWLVNRNNQTATTTTATGTAGPGIVVTNPQSGADLPAQPFTLSGTAPAGLSMRIEDQGQEVGTATADGSGNWSAELPAPTPGEHTYSVIGGEGVRSEFKVNVVEGSGATSGTDATGTGPAGADPSAAGTAAAGAVAFTGPASGAEVPAAGLTLSGTGTAGNSYEVLEDGTSIGNVTVGEDGTWSLAVPAASAGAKTYVLRGADGQEVASLPLTVAAAAAGTSSGAPCAETLTVSLKDGETVSAPYRFGGVGSGDGYVVTVKRGDRVIGTRTVPLGDGCAWSYASNPGGRTGATNQITYEVRPTGADASQPAEASLTLNVRS